MQTAERETDIEQDRPNPVDDSKNFVKPLVRALQSHVDLLANSMDNVAEADRYRVAASWVYTSVLVAWAEDHGLIPIQLRKDAEPDRGRHLELGGTMLQWLVRAFASLAVHPSTECLLDARYNPIRTGTPNEAACRKLVDWWSNDAPDLAYEVDKGPASVTGWLVGDLLQLVNDERRKGNALCQTPWWVCDFLCDQTIVPAAGVWPNQMLRVIDPACGTGHLLVWAALKLNAIYTADGVEGLTTVSPVESVRRIVAGVHGVELEPLTAAVARLRLTVLFGALLVNAGGLQGPLRLHAIPHDIRPQIAVGNALLAGQGDPCPPGTILDDTADYPGILNRGTYHAVVGNPPYITCKDPATNQAIRRAYSEVCSGTYSLAVPFAKLLFDLAIRDDAVGRPCKEPSLFDVLDEGAA